MRFDTVLIANRGEIAVRIMRSLRQMGLGAAAIFTAADRDAAHVRDADHALEVPSYLDAPAIVAAALRVGAGAVHPGYGFLAENAGFARVCAEAGLVFIGPSPEAIALMGDKARAREMAAKQGVPVLTGVEGEDLLAEGQRMGAPLMVKAVMGGGGKGMRLVRDLADLPEALARARSEAEKSFGDGRLILERALLAPRHIEVQVFGDTQGHVIHLGERDCSIQRRHQKVVEEAPSPAVDAELRARMGAAAVSLARACGYVGAGTVEFLLEDGAFWFLEMNTRLQVEHPVTEAVTGIDLVEWQVRVARGEPLPMAQEDVRLEGHAIEVRLYAEDPANGYLPQTGRVLAWHPEPTVRTDHALAQGDNIGAGFDPMLAKIIAQAPTRDAARRRLQRALQKTVLQGVVTNLEFLTAVLAHEGFIQGTATTAFLERDFHGDASLSPIKPDTAMLALAVLVGAGAGAPRFGFTTGPAPRLVRRFEVGGEVRTVALTLMPDGAAQLEDGRVVRLVRWENASVDVEIDGVLRRIAVARDAETLWLDHMALRDVTLAPPKAQGGASDGAVVAPMAGLLLRVEVAPGDTVAAGQVLGIIEAMKMEHPLRAPIAGRITNVHAKAGGQLRARQPLFEIEAETHD